MSKKVLVITPTEEYMTRLATIAEEVYREGCTYDMPKNIIVTSIKGQELYVRTSMFNICGSVTYKALENGNATITYNNESYRTTELSMMLSAVFALGSVVIIVTIARKRVR